jgi:salicylate hydroxylase
MAIEDAVVLSGLLHKAGDEVAAALQAFEKERYLRTARVTITSRWAGDFLFHADGGSRDLRNQLLAQRTPETFSQIDWLYSGIEP